jgi:hypothetical protein
LVQVRPKPEDKEQREKETENDDQRVKSAVMLFIPRLPDGSFRDRLSPLLRPHTYTIGKMQANLFPQSSRPFF